MILNYIKCPTRFDFPLIPGIQRMDGFWIGFDALCVVAPHRVAYRIVIGTTGRPRYLYCIANIASAFIGYGLKIDGEIYVPNYTGINGYVYWQGALGNVFYNGFNFVLFNGTRNPYSSYTNVLTGETFQDSYWIGDIPSFSSRGTKVFQPSGSASGTKTVEIYFPSFVSESRFGEYRNESGSTAVLGVPSFSDETGALYIRGMMRERSGEYSYGAIHYSDGKWGIGDADASGGRYESASGPSVNASTVFRWSIPGGKAGADATRTVTFREYVAGGDQMAAYLGEVAIWR